MHNMIITFGSLHGSGALDPQAQVRRVHHTAVLGGGRHDALTKHSNASHDKKLWLLKMKL